MTEDAKQISIAESKVMEALWRRHPLTADDIIQEVAGPEGWSAATVKTLLNRLLAKHAVAAEKDGRRYQYSPKLTREDYLSAEGQSLLDRLFEGRVASLITHFSAQEKLTAGDVAELKKMIKDFENDS